MALLLRGALSTGLPPSFPSSSLSSPTSHLPPRVLLSTGPCHAWDVRHLPRIT